MHWANYDSEIGAGTYIFPSAAEDEEDRRIRTSWIDGLPHPRGYFGFNEPTELSPSVLVTPKGGTVRGTFQQFVETQIYPAYPNIDPEWVLEEYMTADGPDYRVIKGPVFMQVDSGPDRVNESNLAFRLNAARRGLIIFPGLPNGTAANQLMDGVFGPFKLACDRVCDDIVTERIKAQEDDSTLTITLSNDDLPRMVNGRSNEELKRLKLDLASEMRPFRQSFGPLAITNCLAKLGLCPVDFARACKHPRVRDDTDTGDRGKLIQKIETRHATSLAKLAQVQRPSTLDPVA